MSEEQSTWLQNIDTTSQELRHNEPPELCYGDGSQRPDSQGDENKIAIQENNAASTGAWVDEEDPDPQQTRGAIYRETPMGEDNTDKAEPPTQRWIDNPNIPRLSVAIIIVIAIVILVTRLLILNKPESPAIPSISVRASRRVGAIATSSVSVPANPSFSSSSSSTIFPTLEPSCEIDFDIQIVPPPGGFPNCPFPLSAEPCEGHLTEIVMLYTGGPCSQSYNDQGSQFSCTDYGHGPPTVIGEESYILVTDLSGERIYHSGRVQVMNTFTLHGAHQLITIYNSPELKPENMVQSIQYDSSCSGNMLLLDRFGAVQVLEWVTDEQGRTPSSFSIFPVFDVTVVVDITGGPATIQKFAILKGDLDLVTEPEFLNMDLMTGSDVPAQTSIKFPMDYFYSRRLTYYLWIVLIATTSSGKPCKLHRLHDFTEGCQLPTLFPTQTQTPTTATVPPSTD